MKNLRLTALLGVAAVAGASSAAFAQTDAPVMPAKTEAATPRTRLIPIKNVPPSLMAYWLDPAHNPRPAELGVPDEAGAKGPFDLPGDITQIVAIDPQKALLVAGGSEEDFRRLQELVDVLDQPMRQLELEVQVVEMGAKDALAFGIEIPKATDDVKKPVEPGTFDLQVAPAKGDITMRLNALIAAYRAKVITAPRATAFNNFRVELPLQTNRIVPMTTAISGGPIKLPDIFLRATPTINGDDTISFDIELARNLTASDKAQSQVAAKAIVHTRDGETIVLGNLAPLFPGRFAGVGSYKFLLGDIPPSISALFRSKISDNEGVTLIFITPRIIRQAENKSTPKK